MPPVQYRLHTFGAQVAATATAPHYVHVVGIAKAATQQSPYIVANELICGQVGRVLGLPVPPGFLITANNALHYVSLDFNLAGQPLPPVDVPQFVANDVTLASGLVVFDAWIVNTDRHAQNFSFDTTTKATNIFDHSHAFLGSGANGKQTLEAQRQSLGIGGHVVPPHLTHLDGVKRWIDRVQQLPRFVVEDAIESAKGTGITDDDASFGVDFLMDRCQRLPELFKADQGRFSAIQGGLWAAF